MTGEEFARRAKRCFGYGWQLTLGQAIDVSNSSISRWCRANAVPTYAVAILKMGEMLRRNGLDLPKRFDRQNISIDDEGLERAKLTEIDAATAKVKARGA